MLFSFRDIRSIAVSINVARGIRLTALSLTCAAKAHVPTPVARRLPRMLLDGNA